MNDEKINYNAWEKKGNAKMRKKLRKKRKQGKRRTQNM
jgi:hypothetical protein